MNLETNYMGIKLSNPIIVSSSGLTSSARKVQKIEKAGAGAVVLKSLFEEQINGEVNLALNDHDYPEAFDYVQNYVKENLVDDYLRRIRECKEQCNIPIIASINCYSSGEWIRFAKEIENAGADGIELNMFIMDGNAYLQPGAYEAMYLTVIKQVKEVTTLPISMKIGRNFSNLISLSDQMYRNGLNGMVLFNRFYQPDIDLNKLEMKSGEVYSHAQDIGEVLRWTSLISGKNPQLNISSSTGIHDWEGVVKVLLAGASSAQLCSTIYKNSNEIISQIITCLEEWMSQKGFSSIDEFKGLLSAKNTQYANFYERVQFMKYFDAHN